MVVGDVVVVLVIGSVADVGVVRLLLVAAAAAAEAAAVAVAGKRRSPRKVTKAGARMLQAKKYQGKGRYQGQHS